MLRQGCHQVVVESDGRARRHITAPGDGSDRAAGIFGIRGRIDFLTIHVERQRAIVTIKADTIRACVPRDQVRRARDQFHIILNKYGLYNTVTTRGGDIGKIERVGDHPLIAEQTKGGFRIGAGAGRIRLDMNILVCGVVRTTINFSGSDLFCG